MAQNQKVLILVRKTFRSQHFAKVIDRIESEVINGKSLTFTERKRLIKCITDHGECSGRSESVCRILSGKGKIPSTSRQHLDRSRSPHQRTSVIKYAEKESSVIDLCTSESDDDHEDVEDGGFDAVIDLCTSESDDDYGQEDSIEQQGGGIDTSEIEPVQYHKNITVVEKVKSHNTHFNYTQLEIEFQLKKPENSSEGKNWMEDAFDEVLKILRTESKDGDKIVMKLFLRDNPNHRPIFIGIRPLTALNVPIIFAHLEKVQQSTTVFNSTDVLGVRAYLLHAMSGRGGHRNPSRMTIEESKISLKWLVYLKLKENINLRCNNRLTFPLCRQCTEDLNVFNCTHSDDERALTGFWSLDEVRLAVEHGYKIQKCFELWAYETSQYNRETGERGLFADYVDNFLKIKQESSGWPKDAKSDADKERYIQEYLEKEGIQLEKDKIAVNK
uniref:Uncharacterized protein n=1 Tax=Lutzomyia longipalpis TaxID=7200 RepID=A0A1B0GHC0_LUTLO